MIPTIRGTLKRALRSHAFLRGMGETAQRVLWRHAPGFFDWKPNLASIELDITTRCNLGCFNCSRAVGVAPADESLSMEQLDRFFRQSSELDWRWREIKLVGGEPTLHPRFDEILAVLASYKRAHPRVEVRLVTNGHGQRAQEALSNLPRWMTVHNSAKKSNENSFQTYNVAPVDLPRFRNADFTRGCFVSEYCGAALTRNGLYGCAPGAAVDRVFGFDIGLRSLSMLTEGAVRKQFATLCRLCGHFKYNYREAQATTQETSPSWRDALENYKKAKPVLTAY